MKKTAVPSQNLPSYLKQTEKKARRVCSYIGNKDAVQGLNLQVVALNPEGDAEHPIWADVVLECNSLVRDVGIQVNIDPPEVAQDQINIIPPANLKKSFDMYDEDMFFISRD